MDRKKGLVIASTIFITILATLSGQAQSTDDDLLLTVPAIVAGGVEKPSPLTEIRKLAGSWLFNFDSFASEFRFSGSTATVSPGDPNIATIRGNSYLGGFGFIYSPLSAAYSSRIRQYVAVELWGPPEFDSASYFLFLSANRNSAGDCHYFGDTQGNIRSYYIGFGGTIPCDRLTKSKVSNASGSLTELSTDEPESRLTETISLSNRARDKANQLQHQKNLSSFSKSRISELAKPSDAAKEITAIAKSITQ